MKEISEEEFIDIKKILNKLLQKWYYFIIGITFCLGIAFYIIKTSDKIYEVKATLQLKDQNLSDKGTANQKFINGLELVDGNAALEDEIGLLSSYSIVKKAVSNLNFTVSYYAFDNDWGFLSKQKAKEIYKDNFKVLLKPNVPQIVGAPIYITFIDDNQYKIEVEEEDVKVFNIEQQIFSGEVSKIKIQDTISLNESFQHDFLSFQLNLPDNFVPSSNIGYYFIIHDLNELTISYIDKLEIAQISDNANIVNITTKGTVVEKEEDFLNMLAEVYIQNDLNKKNQLGLRTIEFIDQQLASVSDTLRNVESSLENFRVDNQIVDINLTTQSLIDRLDDLEDEQAKQSIQNEYFKNMASYLYKSEDLSNVVAPSSLGINDPLLNSLLVELSELNREKTGLDYSSNKNNPVWKVLDRKIQNTKATLVDNINSLINSSNMALKQNEVRINNLRNELKRIPENERNLVNIQRRFTLSDNIYNYLLQKRSEAGIALASNVPDKSVVDPARMIGTGPVSPKSKLLLIISILAGFGLPLGLILTQEFFNTKITEKKNLKNITNIPLLGIVAYDPLGAKLVVKDYPNGVIAESFKFLRINLTRYYYQQEKKVIGITSPVEGEGKSYCAANLSVAFAKAKNKTLLIGADLRKPKIQDYFEVRKKGMIEYLLGEADLEEVIQPSSIKGLDILGAGESFEEDIDEVLEMKSFNAFMSQVKARYDIIIVDTPPIGYVADFFTMVECFDINLLVVRYNQTDRNILEAVEEKMENNQIKNLNLIFNGVKSHAFHEYGFYQSKNGYYSNKVNI